MDCDAESGYAQHQQACDTVLGNYQKTTEYAGPACNCEDVCRGLGDECAANCESDSGAERDVCL